MKVTVDLPDSMIKNIDIQAQKDGHSNRGAVIRKAVTLFFNEIVNYNQLKATNKKKEQ